MSQDIPTLHEWAGGSEALNRLTQTFYDKVAQDPIVGPVFKTMSPDHPAHVAAFIGEVFGGPKTYSEQFGGHREMVMHHLGKHLTEEQRRRWINLLADAADTVGLPDDPEFRSAFMGYVEWGSRLAKMNSNLGETCDPETEPMPAWGWGVPGGPYRAPDAKQLRPSHREVREEGTRYLHESRASDFRRELEIDREGLVVSYPDFWRGS